MCMVEGPNLKCDGHGNELEMVTDGWHPDHRKNLWKLFSRLWIWSSEGC